MNIEIVTTTSYNLLAHDEMIRQKTGDGFEYIGFTASEKNGRLETIYAFIRSGAQLTTEEKEMINSLELHTVFNK
jgi:hypothetical protein